MYCMLILLALRAAQLCEKWRTADGKYGKTKNAHNKAEQNVAELSNSFMRNTRECHQPRVRAPQSTYLTG